jgi:hypothetical protein
VQTTPEKGGECSDCDDVSSVVSGASPRGRGVKGEKDGGSGFGSKDGKGRKAVMTSQGSEEMAGVHCRLETKELWDKFYELGTEMIITKTGR